MKNKSLFEGIKCLTRRYTILAIIALAFLINVLYYIVEYILFKQGHPQSLWKNQLILWIVTIFVIAVVVIVFLVNLNAIRDEMVVNLKKLISLIRNQTSQDFAKKIHLEDVSCDDEVFEIVSVINNRSEQIEQYINHLKYVIWYIQHEFNTPLATLALRIERLKKHHHDVDFVWIEEEVFALSKILNSLSLLGSKERENFEYENFPVLPVIQKTVNSLKDEYSDTDVRYTGDLSMHIYSNEIYIHIIMKNLIENAIKYSWEEKIIDIYFHAPEKRIQITDYWKGMYQEEIKNMCLPFWQWDCSRGRDKWLWLWLTLVYELTELLWIHIDVVSEKDVWTTFTLQFP